MFWRKCSVCKKEIGLNSVYQVCSVSSCRKSAFCSVDCWDVHRSVLNHKDAWAQEELSPDQPQETVLEESERAPRRIVVSSGGPSVNISSADVPNDILIVASKLKNYIKAKYDMNTSQSVMDKLSDTVRHLCDEAAANARNDGRKTVMDRDF